MPPSLEMLPAAASKAGLGQRSVSSLATSNTTMPRISNSSVEVMLTGLYKSSNVNLHDFRRPTGKLTQVVKEDSAGRRLDSALLMRSRGSPSKLFGGGKSAGTFSKSNASASILKPLDFSVLKGHTVDRERAALSQIRF